MVLSSKFKIIYRHLIDKDGKCFIKNITPIFEFDSLNELETILKKRPGSDSNETKPVIKGGGQRKKTVAKQPKRKRVSP